MRITPEDANAMVIVTRTVPPKYKGRLDKVRIRSNEITATDGTMAVVRQLPPVDGETPDKVEPCCVNPAQLAEVVSVPGDLRIDDYFMLQFYPDSNVDMPPSSIPKEDGSDYPDIEKVTPSKRRPGQQTAMFDPKKMVQCLKALIDADTIELRIAGADKAVRMDAYWKDGKRAVAVLMPMVGE